MLQVNFLYELGIIKDVKFYIVVKGVVPQELEKARVSLFPGPSDTVCLYAFVFVFSFTVRLMPAIFFCLVYQHFPYLICDF